MFGMLFPPSFAGRLVRLFVLLCAVLCVFLCVQACTKGGGDKFSGYELNLAAAAEEVSFQPQDAISTPFNGSVVSVLEAAERLYIALRREGLFFGGPLMLFLSERPDWGKGTLKGELLFPLSPGRGTPEYLNRDAPGIQTTKRSFDGGRYQFVRYHGPLEALEAGYTRLESLVRGFRPEDCVFVFEDSLRDIERRFHVRIMVRTGR
jgi:hypothetical protein